MASIERHGNLFRVVFRYLGRKYRITLKTDRPREAEGAGSRVEETMRLVKLGTIDPPPDGIDIGQFMLSGGRRQVPTRRIDAGDDGPKVPTLGELFASYEEHFPSGAKEESTRLTERIHAGHLNRLLDKDTPLEAPASTGSASTSSSRERAATSRSALPRPFRLTDAPSG